MSYNLQDTSLNKKTPQRRAKLGVSPDRVPKGHTHPVLRGVSWTCQRNSCTRTPLPGIEAFFRYFLGSSPSHEKKRPKYPATRSALDHPGCECPAWKWGRKSDSITRQMPNHVKPIKKMSVQLIELLDLIKLIIRTARKQLALKFSVHVVVFKQNNRRLKPGTARELQDVATNTHLESDLSGASPQVIHLPAAETCAKKILVKRRSNSAGSLHGVWPLCCIVKSAAPKHARKHQPRT